MYTFQLRTVHRQSLKRTKRDEKAWNQQILLPRDSLFTIIYIVSRVVVSRRWFYSGNKKGSCMNMLIFEVSYLSLIH